MLFFELFPAFMLIVSALAGVGLYVANRRASGGRVEHTDRERERELRGSRR